MGINILTSIISLLVVLTVQIKTIVWFDTDFQNTGVTLMANMICNKNI